MFDFGIGYTEMLVVALVAIVVIGPKDLPRVLRALGKTVAKMRGMAREFQGHLDGAMREAGLDEVKTELKNLKDIGNGTIQPVNKTVPMTDAKKAEDDFKKFFGEPAATPPAAGGSSPAA